MELAQLAALLLHVQFPGVQGKPFPLEPGSPELDIPDGPIWDDHPCFDVSIERGLLLDPSVDDPFDHIVWRPLDQRDPEGPWRAMHRTERGRHTIHFLGLDGRNVDRAGDHIRHRVKPYADRITAALDRGDLDEAQAIWHAALRHLFAPALPFHAASHDALDFFIPAELRARAELHLPRPGAALPDPRVVARPGKPSVYDGLPDELVLAVLAAEATTPVLITKICAARPSAVSELALLLDLSENTTQRHCSQLVRDGQLTQGTDQRFTIPHPQL